ncbi:MAG: NUDIX domain-containing protein [Pseudomonadaceae bacterium]|nr:NUDIX domain-containing protein [Pseudomonadaceae bacterium]
MVGKKGSVKPRKTISKTIAEHGAKAGEMVDIVTKGDKVTKTVSRVEAMEKGLRYRFVQVLVFTPERELWVQWRSRHKMICPRQFSASAGGVVEAGQTYEEAALCELQEELGVTGVDVVEVGRYTVDGKEPYNAAVFACQYDGDDLTGWEEEADALDVMTEEELMFLKERFPYLLASGFVKALEMLEGDEA